MAKISNLHKKKGLLKDVMIGSDVFIGLSKPGILTTDMIHSMADKPVIFALANPIPEIMPGEAISSGAYIIATGRSDYPNQLNNSLVFPGAFKGMLEKNISQFKIEMFSDIAQALADHVDNLSTTKILPTMFDNGVVEIVSNTIQKYN